MARSKPTYKEIPFDSHEEIEFYWWCEEAVEALVIRGFEYQPKPFQLSEPVKIQIPQLGAKGKPIKPKTKTLLRECTYKPDFKLYGYCVDLPTRDENPHIDIKPSFTVRHDDRGKFEVLRKWVFQKYDIFIEPVEPLKWFSKTWCPDKARLTPKTKQPRVRYADLPTLQDFLRTPCES